MDCEKYNECNNRDSDKCCLCYNFSNFKEIKQKKYCGIKKNNNKQTNRMGANAEVINQKSNDSTVETSMTPNSGAGKIKGKVCPLIL